MSPGMHQVLPNYHIATETIDNPLRRIDPSFFISVDLSLLLLRPTTIKVYPFPLILDLRSNLFNSFIEDGRDL